MINFEIWLKVGNFHLHIEPTKIMFIHIKDGIFRYLIDWCKPEPKSKPKSKPNFDDDDDLDPIPF